MSDSENEMTNPNVFGFRNGNMTVNATGPNTNFSFRGQMSSTMCMPRNFERQRYAESLSDQRSIYYRRETSPMSIRSACDTRPRNFQPYYGMGSNQSVYNERCRSPMSMRSVDTTTSLSAADIAFAFSNVNFNKYDLKVIKDAYCKLMKQRVRKRVEKRRNLRLFLKNNRYKSGDDSGEQGSDSSISSDDCRSIKTSYQENMFSNRSRRFDLADFRKQVKENNMVKDCTDNFKNEFSINISRNQHFNSTVSKQSQQFPKIQPLPTLKNRFQNGFLLPSQRFNRSVASSVIPENSERHQENIGLNKQSKIKNVSRSHQNNNIECASDEEIFSQVRDNVIHKNELNPKRSLENDDSNLPVKKKSKLSSPLKTTQTNKETTKNNKNSDSFEFAKPMSRARKSKPKVQEIIIAKSKQPLTGFVDLPNKITNNIDIAKSATLNNTTQFNRDEKENDNQSLQTEFEASDNSNITMRPSFLKRKLFTQKLDVAEKSNVSSDASNSPHNTIYSAIQKEKNKARKLVTNQSCLNREVHDDNNLLDLIHKIVPPDRMNVTNQTAVNHSKVNINNCKNKDDDDDDKWDVTSVMSTCNENDGSDTYTDEEIFNLTSKKKVNNKKEKNNYNTIPETRIRTRNMENKNNTLDNSNKSLDTSTDNRRKGNNGKDDSNISLESCITRSKTNRNNSKIILESNVKTKTKDTNKNKKNNSITIPESKANTTIQASNKNKKDNVKTKSVIPTKSKKDNSKNKKNTSNILETSTKNEKENIKKKVGNKKDDSKISLKTCAGTQNQNDKKNKKDNSIIIADTGTKNTNINKKEKNCVQEVVINKNKKEMNSIKNNTNADSNINKNNNEPSTIKNNINADSNARQCKIIVAKLPVTQTVVENEIINMKSQKETENLTINTGIRNHIVKTYAKTFWDTDFESDADCESSNQRKMTRGYIAAMQTEKVPAAVFNSPAPKRTIKVPEKFSGRWLNSNKSKRILIRNRSYIN